MTSIVQFADIHFGAEDKDAMTALANSVAALKPDITLICGDITQNGSKDEFYAARDWIRTLAGPKLITPGNHDTPMYGLLHRFFAPFKRYQDIIAPLSEPYYTDQYVTIMPINTSRGWQLKPDWSLGVVDIEALEALAKNMKSISAESLKFVIAHHPFLYPPSSPLQKKTKNGKQALKMLSEMNIDAVLSGHVHVPFMLKRQPDETEIMSIGAGTLSVRRREKPASFNHIHVDDKIMRITAIEWSDGEYKSREPVTKKVATLKSRQPH